jgi:hypothetical protein
MFAVLWCLDIMNIVELFVKLKFWVIIVVEVVKSGDFCSFDELWMLAKELVWKGKGEMKKNVVKH